MSQEFGSEDKPDVPASEQPKIGRLADLVGQELGPGFRVVWVSVVSPEYIGVADKVYLLDRELALQYRQAKGNSFYHESFLALTDGRNIFPVTDKPIALSSTTEVEEVIRNATIETLSGIQRRLLGIKND